MLGDMLLAAKRAGPALAEYEVVMRACPNRFGALAGAARAAEESGDAAKAGAYYASLLKLTAASAAAPRPELDRARAFLKIGR
jgi:hypothetical protein